MVPCEAWLLAVCWQDADGTSTWLRSECGWFGYLAKASSRGSADKRGATYQNAMSEYATKLNVN
jgi:hypothetical protein